VPLGIISDPAELGHSATVFFAGGDGCSYNGMKISNGIRVLGHKTWEPMFVRIRRSARGISPLDVRTAALIRNISHRTCCMVCSDGARNGV
jgi:hypothetical protein